MNYESAPRICRILLGGGEYGDHHQDVGTSPRHRARPSFRGRPFSLCGTDEPEHPAAVKWSRGLDEERVWAIEDCRQVARRPEQALTGSRRAGRARGPLRMSGLQARGASARQIRCDRLARDRPRGRQGRGRELPGRVSGRAGMEIRLLFDQRNDPRDRCTPARDRRPLCAPRLAPAMAPSCAIAGLQTTRRRPGFLSALPGGDI